jgi:hypothetical protein
VSTIDGSIGLSKTPGLSDADRATILLAGLLSLRAALREGGAALSVNALSVKNRSEIRKTAQSGERRSGMRWEPEEERHVKTLWDEGLTLERIGAAVERSPGAIAARLAILESTDRQAIRELNVARGGVYGRLSVDGCVGVLPSTHE